MKSSVRNKVKAALDRFPDAMAEEFASELVGVEEENIVAGLTEKTKPYSPDQVKECIQNNLLWPLFPEELEKGKRYRKIIARIPLRLMGRLLDRARPDLAEAILSEPGGKEWFKRNIGYFQAKLGSDGVKPEDFGLSVAEQTRILAATCDHCKGVFSYPEGLLPKICPFCLKPSEENVEEKQSDPDSKGDA